MRRWARITAAVLAGCVLAACSAQTQQGASGSGGAAQALSGETAEIQQLRRRAEQGDASAQARLGGMYEFGEGVPQDYMEALRWYRLAAEQGDAFAQSQLGSMYYLGEDVPMPGTAFRYNPDAERLERIDYQNYVEAARWYRLAAEQGSAIAQNNLGSMYHSGRGVPQNYVEAARWYRLAAEQGNATAQSQLGEMYRSGQGVPEDIVEAYKWYNLAAVARDEKVREARDLVMKDMTPAQIAEGQRRAAEWRPTTAPQQ